MDKEHQKALQTISEKEAPKYLEYALRHLYMVHNKDFPDDNSLARMKYHLKILIAEGASEEPEARVRVKEAVAHLEANTGKTFLDLI